MAAFLGLCAATVAAPVAESLAKKGDAQLVSRQSQQAGAMAANDESNGTAISGNGRIAAFDTLATNLGGPIDANRNVYVRVIEKKRTQLVSRRSESAGGAGGNGDSSVGGLSSTGRFVVFDTDSDNLGAAQGSGGLEKVYVYDRKRKKAKLVSRRSKAAGGDLANGNSNGGGISGNGRFATFGTAAGNLGGPAKDVSNVYVYDLTEKRVSLVSRRSKSAGGKGANGTSIRPSISDSGRFVAFDSEATNLSAAAKDVTNCFVYDRNAKVVELVSRRSQSAGGAGANDDCDNASISGDGRHVMFRTTATNLGGDNTPDEGKIYVYDRARDKVELVSRRSKNGPAADEGAETGEISANGRFAGFMTDATNLGGPIVGGHFHSYLYDRKLGKARLVSRRSKSIGGGAANESSFHPDPSANGRYSVFLTNATNLGGPVVMAGQQVYRYDLLGP